MSWFDEQIKTRIKSDEENFKNSFLNLSSVVSKNFNPNSNSNHDIKTKNAIYEILKYYNVKPIEIDNNIKDINQCLEFLLRPSGIMRRSIKLTDNWYKDSIGPLLAQTVDGDTIALLPKGFSGYQYFDYKKNKKVKITKKNKDFISPEAICFYYPLPLKELTIKDLIKYMIKNISMSDILTITIITLAISAIGLLSPMINNIIFSQIIPSRQTSLIIPITCSLIGFILSSTFISIYKTLVMAKIQSKLDISIQSASMSRLLSLPTEFFKEFNAGELASRLYCINSLCSMITSAVLSSALSALFSLIYIGQIIHYTPSLAIPAMSIIIITLIITFITLFIQIEITRKKMKIDSKISGLIFSLFSGIQKIKIAGAERRAFVKWADMYKESATLQYNPPLLIKLNPVISTVITSIGTIIIFYFAAISQVSVADYMTFNVTYGMVSGAMGTLITVALTFANIKPIMEMIEPILKAKPEVDNCKKVVTKMSGKIELNNISFKYEKNTPLIIDNLSIKVDPGQYIAVVGKTGSGKSTLVRLMLGFEKPQKGYVYYDDKDLNSLDLKSVRQNIGVVMQNGKLFTGDIYSNIVISAPWLSIEEAWEAAEIAGIADDIRKMPMGMFTMIAEGYGGISGGQKQRLMIARAIASKPKILILDEATSALDNITQKKVSDSLSKLKSTRIVIAHRLSTIKQCDRIIVIDKGKIVEDGTYDQLINNNGFFNELVKRQQITENKTKTTL